MEKKVKTKLPYFILALLALFFCWLFCIRNGVFGSRVDWISQHSVFPEYFRQLFYDTGQFFPEFAANIGGGQNIYNFSYYGLYSPVVLISYLFPCVEMGTYIMAAMMIHLVIALLLFYRWLLHRGISHYISFFVSVLFLLSGPMIYHFYNQIMFVNYMPFLCMALIGVDRYFEKRKAGIYTLSVWMMILTSFYFSIGGMLVLVIYGISRYVERKEISQEGIRVRTFLWDGMQFLFPMLIAVLLSAVLLVPTACVLMNGRTDGTPVSFWKLFIPDIEIFRFVYTPYGIGLTTLVITVLISGLTYRKRNERWLHIGCIIILSVPLFAWLLNGGLYIRDKVVIPFLPLLCYLIAKYMEKQRTGEIPFLTGLLPFLFTILLIGIKKEQIGNKEYWILLLIDAIIMVVCFLICYWKKCMQFLVLPPLIFLTVYGVMLHESADMSIDPAFYEQVTDKNIQTTIEEIAEQETGFYRMEQSGTAAEDAANINRIWSVDQYISSIYSSVYHEQYQDFRTEIFQTEQPYRNMFMQSGSKNPVFQRFMGIKYIISDKDVSGYEKIAENVYENKDVLPIAYVTKRLLSEEEYRKLEFPYNQLALLECAVVEDETEEPVDKEDWSAGLQKLDLLFEDEKIQSQESVDHTVEIPEANEGDLFFLQFKVNNHCPSKDVSIWVEGIRNKLTANTHIYYNANEEFTYAIPLKEGQTKIDIRFGAGDYEIAHLNSYIWKETTLEDQRNELVQSEFQMDKEETKGNVIKGIVEGDKDGYLITSIPYDENFEILIDGKETEYEKVNTAFLGMKVQEGKHEIEMIYHAPGVMIGKILSMIGVVVLVQCCTTCSEFYRYYAILSQRTKDVTDCIF